MHILISPHAEQRMRDRDVSEVNVREVLRSPGEVISVRYGRLAAHKEIGKRELVVVYEKENEEIEVITVLWVDKRRLRRLGFTRV